MKVWKIKDLGLQTLQVIQSMSIKESSTEAMQKFQDIVQNFPKFAASVSSVKIKSTVRNDLTAWYSSQAANALPQNTVLVNGKRIELGGSTFNVFDLLKELKTEVQILDKLRGLKFPKQANDQIMQVANKVGNPVFEENSVEAAVGGPIIRIDVSKGGKYVVNFVNNLEKDPEYKSWPKQLQTLLYPSWNLHALSRNLYTIVAIVDVFSSTGANMLLELQMLHLQQFPVRCGFVLACENERGNFCRLFAHIREVKGIKFATEFAYAVARAVAESEEVSNELLLSLATEASSSISKSAGLSLKTILQSAERHIDFVSNTTAYLEARNLPMNSFSLNGIVAAGHSIQQSLMQLVSREQYILSHYVRTKLLAEKSKSIFNDIMGITQSYARYHPILDEQDPTYVDFAGVDGYGLLHELTYVNPKLSISTPVSDRSMLNAANNLILSIPTTASGFESALNALQWVHHQETPTEENFIRSTHIAILWKSVSDGQAGKSTCSVSDGDQDGSCSINTTQELLPVLLDSMVDALSVRHDSTSPALCDSFCTTALEKVNYIAVYCFPKS